MECSLILVYVDGPLSGELNVLLGIWTWFLNVTRNGRFRAESFRSLHVPNMLRVTAVPWNPEHVFISGCRNATL
jgi:hypothetical protein